MMNIKINKSNRILIISDYVQTIRGKSYSLRIMPPIIVVYDQFTSIYTTKWEFIRVAGGR